MCEKPTLHCGGCAKGVHRLLSLMRGPRLPHERRVCDDCRKTFETAGWTTVRTFVPLKSPPPFVVHCGECGGKVANFHIVSQTGEPVVLERCEPCAMPLRADGWRIATVRGSR